MTENLNPDALAFRAEQTAHALVTACVNYPDFNASGYLHSAVKELVTSQRREFLTRTALCCAAKWGGGLRAMRRAGYVPRSPISPLAVSAMCDGDTAGLLADGLAERTQNAREQAVYLTAAAVECARGYAEMLRWAGRRGLDVDALLADAAPVAAS